MSEKKEVKTIFVGGSEDLVKQVSELYKDDKFITIVILENEDLNKLVDDKMREQQTATVSGYVKDKENRKRALLIAKEIQTVFGEQMEKDFVQTSFVKRSTKYSWKEFNNLIDTLDLFGFIKWGDLRKKTFKIIIGKEDMKENKRVEAQAALDFASSKLTDYQNILTTQAERKKIETIKKRLIIK